MVVFLTGMCVYYGYSYLNALYKDMVIMLHTCNNNKCRATVIICNVDALYRNGMPLLLADDDFADIGRIN